MSAIQVCRVSAGTHKNRMHIYGHQWFFPNYKVLTTIAEMQAVKNRNRGVTLQTNPFVGNIVKYPNAVSIEILDQALCVRTLRTDS
jgi:hypothetical protein